MQSEYSSLWRDRKEVIDFIQSKIKELIDGAKLNNADENNDDLNQKGNFSLLHCQNVLIKELSQWISEEKIPVSDPWTDRGKDNKEHELGFYTNMKYYQEDIKEKVGQWS